MPFPWKKNRVTRISQIVADLQSPKRGGSLVVQTGFPTSLIDLFVKNKSRFKKPTSKKHVQPETPDPPPPSPALTHPPSPIIPLAEAPRLSQLVVANDDAAEVSGRIVECGPGAGPNMAVGVLVKMFVVVVLILSVKRLTVGITVSAFALVLLEYAGKRVVSNANVAVESFACTWFQKVLQLKKKKKESCELAIVPGEILVESVTVDEIEVVETIVVGPGPELDSSISMGIKVVEPSECKTRGRFRSKMVKKLVPKKFRGSGYKKEKRDKTSRESSAVGTEDKSRRFEIEEEPQESGNNSSSLLLKTKLECGRDDGVDCGITCSQESLAVSVTVSNEEKKMHRVGNSGYPILLAIALAGLVVGRFPAFVLTLTCCFMVKIVKTLWRSHNVPNS